MSASELSRQIEALVESEHYYESIPFMEQAANDGDEKYQSILANLYTFGYVVEKDEDKAFHYTLLAALNGNADMMVNLAVFYKHGQGTEVDHEQALYWFEQASLQNHPSAYYGLALAYYYGEGCYQDFKLARKYAMKTASLPCEYQQQASELIQDIDFDEALEILNSIDRQEGLQRLTDLANAGHIKSMVMLSAELTRQDVPGCDLMEAFKWAYQAAIRDEPAGMYNTAIYYWYGIGVRRSFKESFLWMKNAAKAGYEDAWAPLAQMYYCGQGVHRNLNEAMVWISKAARAFRKDTNTLELYKRIAMELELTKKE
jgi:TPR repeat protein